MVRRLLKYVLLTFLASTYKTLPGFWVSRFYYQCLVRLVLPYRQFVANGRKVPGNTLFKPSEYRTYVSPLEIDMYLHKSNSTYFADLDIARTKLVSERFGPLFWNYYDNIGKEFRGKSVNNLPYVPIGSIQASFKKELTVYQRYYIRSRVFAWDNKWVYILSQFVVKDPNTKKETLCCAAVTKYVFKKKGRITIRPEEMFRECGLWDEELTKENELNYKLVEHMRDIDEIEEICKAF